MRRGVRRRLILDLGGVSSRLMAGTDGAIREARRARMAEMMIPWAIDQSIPALAYPVRGDLRRSAGTVRADVTWLIIQLNPNVLKTKSFPNWRRKFFGGAHRDGILRGSADRGNDGERVFYSSGAGFGEEQKSAGGRNVESYWASFRTVGARGSRA